MLIRVGYGPAIKAGEFIMGYPDELGETATNPEPDVLRHNGTFLAFRKFHTRVAAFRQYLREQAASPEEEELIAAKNGRQMGAVARFCGTLLPSVMTHS